jgi:hypothetical protein
MTFVSCMVPSHRGWSALDELLLDLALWAFHDGVGQLAVVFPPCRNPPRRSDTSAVWFSHACCRPACCSKYPCYQCRLASRCYAPPRCAPQAIQSLPRTDLECSTVHHNWPALGGKEYTIEESGLFTLALAGRVEMLIETTWEMLYLKMSSDARSNSKSICEPSCLIWVLRKCT